MALQAGGGGSEPVSRRLHSGLESLIELSTSIRDFIRYFDKKRQTSGPPAPFFSSQRESHEWNLKVVRRDYISLITILNTRCTALTLALKIHDDGDLAQSALDRRERDGVALCSEINNTLTNLNWLIHFIGDHQARANDGRLDGDDKDERLKLGKTFQKEIFSKTETILDSFHYLLDEYLYTPSQLSGDLGLKRQRERVLTSMVWSASAGSILKLGDDLPLKIGTDLSKDNQEAAMKAVKASEDFVSDILEEVEGQVRSKPHKSSPTLSATADGQDDISDISDDAFDPDISLWGADLKRAQYILPLVRLIRLSIRKCIQRRLPLLFLDDDSGPPRSQETDQDAQVPRNNIIDRLDAITQSAAYLVSALEDMASIILPDMDVHDLLELSKTAIDQAIAFIRLTKSTPRSEKEIYFQAGVAQEGPDEHEAWFDLAHGQLEKMKIKLPAMLLEESTHTI